MKRLASLTESHPNAHFITEGLIIEGQKLDRLTIP